MKKMLKFADEQIAYWQKYRQREQRAWNNAYVNYCDWLKKQGKEPEKKKRMKVWIVKQANGESAQ